MLTIKPPASLWFEHIFSFRAFRRQLGSICQPLSFTPCLITIRPFFKKMENINIFHSLKSAKRMATKLAIVIPPDSDRLSLNIRVFKMLGYFLQRSDDLTISLNISSFFYGQTQPPSGNTQIVPRPVLIAPGFSNNSYA